MRIITTRILDAGLLGGALELFEIAFFGTAVSAPDIDFGACRLVVLPAPTLPDDFAAYPAGPCALHLEKRVMRPPQKPSTYG